MIASPGDVVQELDIIRSVIHDWNDINAAATRVMLTPVGWETHATPELGARPQDLINARVLKDCDLLVGVFWTRLGTPTGKAQSGTVEEINKHIETGKPAMIYFSSRPVAPESIDADQFAEVQSFKAQCKELGLIEGFDDAAQFKEKFAKQLHICLVKNPYLRRLVKSTAMHELADEEEAANSLSTYRLSEEAITLLKAVASRDDGTIMKLAFVGGRVIQAGGQSFGEGRGRESAKWENALSELVNEGLVVARGYKDQVFELTHQGWALADSL